VTSPSSDRACRRPTRVQFPRRRGLARRPPPFPPQMRSVLDPGEEGNPPNRVVRPASLLVRRGSSSSAMTPVNRATKDAENAPPRGKPSVKLKLDFAEGRYKPDGDASDPAYYMELSFIATPADGGATHIIQDVTNRTYVIDAEGKEILRSEEHFREFAALDPPGTATTDDHSAWVAEHEPGICGYRWHSILVSWTGKVTTDGVDNDKDGKDDPATGNGHGEKTKHNHGSRAPQPTPGSMPQVASDSSSTTTSPATGAYSYDPDTPPADAVRWEVDRRIEWCTGVMDLDWGPAPESGGGTPTPPDSGGGTPTPPGEGSRPEGGARPDFDHRFPPRQQ